MHGAIKRAQDLLEDCGLASIITLSPLDIFYCTGRRINHGSLLVTKEGAFLCTDARYSLLASDLKDPFQVFTSSTLLPFIEVFERIKGPIGFDSETLTYGKYQKLCHMASGAHFVPAPEFFQLLRRKKSPEEIHAIEKSCQLCDAGFSYMLEQIKPGITEKQLSQKLKTFWFENGAEALSFEPIIAFGANTACPHWQTSGTSLEHNNAILIDIGVALDGYHSDMTRMVFFGQPEKELIACYHIVKEAYDLAFAAARPGISPHELDRVAREHIAHRGYQNAFIHGLGHGVGLAVHESPHLSSVVKDTSPLLIGDVFTIEPGIYIPGKGGVRFENLVAVEEKETRSLSKITGEPIFL